ncbi:hypothetical protein LTR53_014014 [Teratosphaeriaceae sp. CCFEE 6253]|nr:hypothetical protein LTR53_014014 [Teratosphaeriaceae sp. CCFEE 6253]
MYGLETVLRELASMKLAISTGPMVPAIPTAARATPATAPTPATPSASFDTDENSSIAVRLSRTIAVATAPSGASERKRRRLEHTSPDRAIEAPVRKPHPYKRAVEMTLPIAHSLRDLISSYGVEYVWQGERRPATELLNFPDVVKRLETKLQVLLTEKGFKSAGVMTRVNPKCAVERAYDNRDLASVDAKVMCKYGMAE